MTASTGIRNAHKMGRYLIEADTSSGICAFGGVDASKEPVEEMPSRINAQCHAAYSYMFDDTAPPLWIADKLYSTELDDEIVETWLQYVLMESPFSEMFLEPNIYNGLKRGYYIYTTDCDGNILAGGSVAVRQLSEHKHIPKAFHRLIKAGMNNHIAFYMAHMVKFNGHNFTMYERVDEGHMAMVPSMLDRADLSNYIKGNYYEFANFQQNPGYNGFNAMWDVEGYDGDIFEPKYGNINKEIYNDFMSKVIHNEEDVPQQRAIFNHRWNRALDQRRQQRNMNINTKLNLPILVEMGNKLYEELS